MTGDDFKPDWYSPPGDTIRDLLEERGIPASGFAASIGLTDDQCSALLCGELVLDEHLAQNLEKALGVTAKFWVRREATYRKDRSRVEEMRRAAAEAIGYRAVDPVGVRTAVGHVNRGPFPHAWGEFTLPVYPESPEGARLRGLRTELGLTLMEASRVVGIGAAQFSALERGAAACDWVALAKLLRDGKDSDASQ